MVTWSSLEPGAPLGENTPRRFKAEFYTVVCLFYADAYATSKAKKNLFEKEKHTFIFY